MGDAPQTHVFPKALIFLSLFLALYICLIALIPSDFYAGLSAEGSTFDYSYLSLEDIKNIRFLQQENITRPAVFQNNAWFDFNPDINFKMRATWTSYAHSYPDKLFFEHLTWEFLFFQQFDSMKVMEYTETAYVYNRVQYVITRAILISNWDSTYNASILKPVQCTHVSTKVWVMDTNATRNDIGEAWDDGALTISMGFGFSDYETKTSAVDILGRLLTFQAPIVYGLTGDMATIVTLITTIPFYILVGTLIFLVVMAIVPF